MGARIVGADSKGDLESMRHGEAMILSNIKLIIEQIIVFGPQIEHGGARIDECQSSIFKTASDEVLSQVLAGVDCYRENLVMLPLLT